MITFVDTSAFLALLDADEASHPAVRGAWVDLLETRAPLLTTNYVLVETHALVQRRLGLRALRCWVEDLLPVVRVLWVSEEEHHAAVRALLAMGRRAVSLVDCVSFEAMRSRGVRRAFTLDRHFREQGFLCVP
ncbi:type II toxin-antitoxin system VapC family toxin [Deferrisoma sp.]|nr:MAG: PIN domain-containing protein [Candidatus Dadabacteria bacterium]